MRCDAAVVGAGPAGSAAALTLARHGLKTLLIEARETEPSKIGESLAPAATPLLAALGLHAQQMEAHHLPYHGNRSAWGSEGLTEADFLFHRYGSGWQLDRILFERQLSAAAEDAGAAVLDGTILASVRAGRGWELSLRPNRHGLRSVRASWIVDATGRRGAVVRRLGLRRRTMDRMVCVYAMAWCPDPQGLEDMHTVVESTPEGWWYTVPTPGGGRTVAWLTDADLLPPEWRNLDWFLGRLRQTRHIRNAIDSVEYAWPEVPDCTSASSSHLEAAQGPGWIAVGDAVMTFDPISSRGLFHSLCTGHHGALAILRKETLEYGMAMDEVWHAYLSQRQRHYLLEARWPDKPFWARRR